MLLRSFGKVVEADRPRWSVVLRYIASSGSLLASNAAQIVTFGILARSLGPQEFGTYVSFMAVATVAVYVCGLGAAECLMRRVPQDHAAYPVLFGHNLLLIGSTGTLLVLIGTLTMPHLLGVAPTSASNVITTFVLLLTNIVLVRLIMLAETVFLGFQLFGAANRAVIGFALARTAPAALACLVFGVQTIEGWALWQFACHGVLAGLYGTQLVRLGRPRFQIAREELHLGIFFATPFIFRAVRQNADLMVLGVVAGPEVVASYGVARRISDSSYMAVDALNRIMYPGLARLAAQGRSRVARRSRQLLPASVALGCLAAAAMLIIAPWLPILFGTSYVSLPLFGTIMSGYIVFVAIWSVAVESLGASGLHRLRAWVLNSSNGVGAAVIALSTWLMPPWGAFVGNYLTELAITVAAWAVFIRLTRSTRLDDSGGDTLTNPSAGRREAQSC